MHKVVPHALFTGNSRNMHFVTYHMHQRERRPKNVFEKMIPELRISFATYTVAVFPSCAYIRSL